MSSIAGITCTFLKGQPPAPKQRMHVWTVPGMSGYGAQILGQSDQEFQVVAIFYSNAVGVQAFRTAIEALQSQIVSLTNDLGSTHGNCLITKVGQAKITAARGDGGVTQRIEIPIAGCVLPS